MNPNAQLRRSMSKLAVDTHRRIRARERQTMYYEICERENKFQHPFSGELGFVPAEGSFKILFDILFVGDPGVRSDTQLGEPLFRYGFRLTSGPSGTLLYAYVSDWVQDEDLNFTGAIVTVGAHNPGILDQALLEQVKFSGIFHSSFQGYGVPIDDLGVGVSGT